MKLFKFLSILLLGLLIKDLNAGKSLESQFQLDYRYAPAEWQTSICLPDDWQKSLIDKNGDLLYDYPGTIGGFGTRINFYINDKEKVWKDQKLFDAKTPIVETTWKFGEVDLKTEFFAVTDETIKKLKPLPPNIKSDESKQGFQPVSSHEVIYNATQPIIDCDPEFKSLDIGWGKSLKYRLKSRSTNLVFGFCEGHWDKIDQRIMEIKVDGVVKKIVDAIKVAKKNEPFIVTIEAKDITGDGFLDIEISSAPDASDLNPVLNVLWAFDKLPTKESIISGEANNQSLAFLRSGAETPPKHTGPPRTDLLIVTISNNTNTKQDIDGIVQVRSSYRPKYISEKNMINIRDWRMVNISEKAKLNIQEKENVKLDLEKISIEAGESKKIVVSVNSNAEGMKWTVSEAEKALENAKSFWANYDLPYNVIEIPDNAMQDQIDGAIRNIYQAREIKNGLPSFQVGPTQYRGLWIVDGAFILETIASLNRATETRAGIKHMLSFQKPDGSFEKIGQFWKENGIVLWVIDRHFQLTGDDKWLTSNWSVVEKIMNFIPVLRERSRKDKDALSYDFIPSGYSDGGLNIDHEYTNAYWILIGIKSAVNMAKKKGFTEKADKWQKEYDDLWNRYLTLAERDLITDEFGNKMLPIHMSRPLKDQPQKGQWAFMHAIYPGEIFENDNPIMQGTLANISTNIQEGLIYGTGWDDEGLWNYFGSFYGHALLYQGEGQKAAKTAYAFANHASPLLVWREEQRVKGHPEPHWVGDMPHNWASAEFIRLVMHMLIFERKNELHLLEGLPPTWLQAGKRTAINKALTRFGEVSIVFDVDENGKNATLTVDLPTHQKPEKLIAHLNGKSYDLYSLGTKQGNKIWINLRLKKERKE